MMSAEFFFLNFDTRRDIFTLHQIHEVRRDFGGEVSVLYEHFHSNGTMKPRSLILEGTAPRTGGGLKLDGA